MCFIFLSFAQGGIGVMRIVKDRPYSPGADIFSPIFAFYWFCWIACG